MTDPEIILQKEIEPEKPIIIEGFPGVGLIGNIATRHIIKAMEFDEVGLIKSERFPPVAIIEEGETKHPLRIYNKNQYIIFTSDIPMSSNLAKDIAHEIVQWSIQQKSREIISIAGISTTSQATSRVFTAARDKKDLQGLEDQTERFTTGNILGFTGCILNESKLQEIPAITLLGETRGIGPDPRSAADVIKILNQYLDLNIDTTKLIEEAEKIEEEMNRMMQRMEEMEETKKPTIKSPMYQ
ncbi:proteasome assembly chaperone family protein [Methanonatronarchaeum sp. AMET-Sl]|uniref:proteasome assembly chaperone family protein n=1 Tax=Methanonatronarchaeum sp. AMET-Sl TaxID=3037654 RepID=UPI00244E4869|nr:proteasome assembly chaperone family protein [Methanonatronarchaeum sp. AMET-Sl]WGI18004.1 proteasome assembly chaperone family protein [Methanonatronarchaeum sp. AMET-Sl]